MIQHDPLAYVVVAALVAVIIVLVRALRDERRQHAAQLDRQVLLHKAETLDQFAAIEGRLAKDRREEQRGGAERGQVTAQGAPVARKRPSVVDVFRRAPRPRSADAPPQE